MDAQKAEIAIDMISRRHPRSPSQRVHTIPTTVTWGVSSFFSSIIILGRQQAPSGLVTCSHHRSPALSSVETARCMHERHPNNAEGIPAIPVQSTRPTL